MAKIRKQDYTRKKSHTEKQEAPTSPMDLTCKRKRLAQLVGTLLANNWLYVKREAAHARAKEESGSSSPNSTE